MKRPINKYNCELHLGYSEDKNFTVKLNENLLGLNMIEFYETVCSWYSTEFGMEKIASCEQICRAIDFYYKDKKVSDMYFDSVDRENVLQLILDNTFECFDLPDCD